MNNESLKEILKECLDDMKQVTTDGFSSNAFLNRIKGRLEALLIIATGEEE